MESLGDFYPIALHDDQLRRGLVALQHGNRQHKSAFARTLRLALAAALRAVAGGRRCAAANASSRTAIWAWLVRAHCNGCLGLCAWLLR
jgi:hypothetical protein